MKNRLFNRSSSMLVIPVALHLLWSVHILINKGIPSGLDNWRFYASLVGILIFSVLTAIFLLKSLKAGSKSL